ncbi:hypothetical protein F2P56_015165, partial [Juglans regia]
MARLERLVGSEAAERVLEVFANCKEGSDLLIWTNSESGKFSTKSAWDCVRVRGQNFEGNKWIWNSILPKKISVFMWKAWHGALAVDDKIRRIGIPLVSRCNCCIQGQYEDLNHVLFAGEEAAEVWKKIGVMLGLPILLEGTGMKHVLVGLGELLMPLNLVSFWQVPIKQQQIDYIAWSKPEQGCVKLNTDGSSLGNPGVAGAGGVIWDMHGNMLLAFSKNIGYGTSNYAELRALVEGVKHCKNLNFTAVDVEMDSKVVLA